MNFYEVLKSRRSVRVYDPTPIPESVLERLYEAVKYAPSACNLQPWKILVVTNPEAKAKLCAACSQKALQEAPAIVVALGNSDKCWHRPEGDAIIPLDIGIVMEHVVLAAAAEGLASCWICAYDMKRVDAAIGAAAPWHVYALSPLGYPGEAPAMPPRKRREDVFGVIS